MTTAKSRTSPNDFAALERSAGEVAALLRALGNERRLMLMCMLIEQGECTAGELGDGVGLSPSATSQHLAKMREEGLVDSRREAQSVYYRIADPRTKRLIGLLKDLYCK
jgi:DNA-binding transcriptional ArsR family regulator